MHRHPQGDPFGPRGMPGPRGRGRGHGHRGGHGGRRHEGGHGMDPYEYDDGGFGGLGGGLGGHGGLDDPYELNTEYYDPSDRPFHDDGLSGLGGRHGLHGQPPRGAYDPYEYGMDPYIEGDMYGGTNRGMSPFGYGGRAGGFGHEMRSDGFDGFGEEERGNPLSARIRAGFPPETWVTLDLPGLRGRHGMPGRGGGRRGAPPPGPFDYSDEDEEYNPMYGGGGRDEGMYGGGLGARGGFLGRDEGMYGGGGRGRGGLGARGGFLGRDEGMYGGRRPGGERRMPEQGYGYGSDDSW